MEKIQLDTSTILGNLFSGLTVAALSFPLALAFGVQSGMGAFAGLFAAIAIGMMTAWFGGTPSMISGPTGPMTVISAAIIALSIETSGSLSAAMGSIITIFVLAGIIQIILGLFKAGAYFRYIPYPVVTGFFSGIGILLIVLQIFPVLGYSSPKNVVDIFIEAPGMLKQVNYAAVGLASATLAIIYLLPKISLTLPGSFVALIVLTPVVTMLGLDVNLIGHISTGYSDLQMDKLTLNQSLGLSTIVISALILAVVGAIESLLTAV
ncbi:MAG: SulP family inorganic anion transporter, partial [Gammaproteobacteria bacterium]|nr:SulP family inorganic anion transporter [Gammaproteobacteria bacterium]